MDPKRAQRIHKIISAGRVGGAGINECRISLIENTRDQTGKPVREDQTGKPDRCSGTQLPLAEEDNERTTSERQRASEQRASNERATSNIAKKRKDTPWRPV
jgi:hypothetical protein